MPGSSAVRLITSYSEDTLELGARHHPGFLSGIALALNTVLMSAIGVIAEPQTITASFPRWNQVLGSVRVSTSSGNAIRWFMPLPFHPGRELTLPAQHHRPPLAAIGSDGRIAAFVPGTAQWNARLDVRPGLSDAIPEGRALFFGRTRPHHDDKGRLPP